MIRDNTAKAAEGIPISRIACVERADKCRLLVAVYQAPPRKTRYSPLAGPVGFLVGELLSTYHHKSLNTIHRHFPLNHKVRNC